jgi:hypothetical protein
MYKTGGACAMYGRGEVNCIVFLREKLKEREHLENLGIDGKLILQWTSNTITGHTLDRSDKWLGVVNMNLRVPQNQGHYQVLKRICAYTISKQSHCL